MRLASLPAGLLALASALPSAATEDWPDPIQALVDQGLTIHSEFEAPGGLAGFAASHRGREMAVYLTPDGEHAVIGNLVDAEGNNLSEPPLDRLVRGPREAETWEALADSAWIADGRDDAERIVYVFTDPNCPYCRQFFQAARRWVEAGGVQLRHVMVGILEHDSPRLAISLLAADDPSAALAAHEAGAAVTPLATLPRQEEVKLQENHALMEQLGLYATPGLVYRDKGRLATAQGMPDDQRMVEIMGSPAP